MAQNFLACDREQELLLPPSLREWLPDGHLAWFVIDAVAEIPADSPGDSRAPAEGPLRPITGDPERKHRSWAVKWTGFEVTASPPRHFQRRHLARGKGRESGFSSLSLARTRGSPRPIPSLLPTSGLLTRARAGASGMLQARRLDPLALLVCENL